MGSLWADLEERQMGERSQTIQYKRKKKKLSKKEEKERKKRSYLSERPERNLGKY